MNLTRRIFLHITSLACLVAFATSSVLSKDVDWQANLADGNHELAVGNSEKAVDIFRRKVAKYPTSGACHTALGRALKRLGKIDEAKSEFRQATEVEPTYADGFYELGCVQESDKNFADAARCFAKFLELKPDTANRQALGDRIQYCQSQSPVPVSQTLPVLPISQPSNSGSASPLSTQAGTQPVVGQVPSIPVSTKTISASEASVGQAIQQQSVVNKPPATSNESPAKSEDNNINRPIRDKWALIIGISSFANQQIPSLKYASKDARDLYSYLVHEANFAPDHVRLILDEKATERRIMSELGSKFLARLAKPDDLIFLFFSTHGSPSQMDVRGKNYIVAYDSDPDDLFATGIEMQKILEAIQSRVLSDRVLLVLDACHSGGVNPNAKGMMRVGNFDAVELAEGSGQMVICSSKPDQQSWESKRYQNGVFTRNLLEGLRKAGAKAPLSKAFSTMEQLVADEVREDYPGARQTPLLQSKWNGNELVIGVRPNAPQKIPPTVACDLEPDSSGQNAATTQPPRK
jgi:tetratricopeptide (TPR) repeat protein